MNGQASQAILAYIYESNYSSEVENLKNHLDIDLK